MTTVLIGSVILAGMIGLIVSVRIAVSIMNRSNARCSAIVPGTMVAPVPLLIVAIAGAPFMPDHEWRTGVGGAFVLSALFLSGFLLFLGLVVSAAIAFNMKEADEEVVVLRNLEDELRG